MAYSLPPLAPVSLLVVLLLPVLSTAKPKLSFTTELIHRDSPRSPYHNSSLSPAERLREAARRSIDLSRHPGYGVEDFSAPTFPSRHFEYLMSFFIGTPPFNVLALVDTGSDLVWVQCEPCDACYSQEPPKFDPSRSSTYKDVPCNTTTCSAVTQSSCSDDDICEYDMFYADKSYSIGSLATERLTFSSRKRAPVSFSGFALGCTHASMGLFPTDGGGLVGLGRGHISLVSQLSESIDGKFSYCLVSHSEQGKSSSITFGSTLLGSSVVTTPMSKDTFYFVSLDSIEVAGGMEIALEGADEGNIVIDSGTTLTLLPMETVAAVVRELSSMIKLPKVRSPLTSLDLCFRVDGSTRVEDFPDLVFNFRGGEVRLPVSNTFVRVEEGVLCLAMRDHGHLGTSVYGNVAQQNFRIGFDLFSKEVSFLRTDCTKVA